MAKKKSQNIENSGILNITMDFLCQPQYLVLHFLTFCFDNILNNEERRSTNKFDHGMNVFSVNTYARG